MELQWGEYCYQMDSNGQLDTPCTDLDYKSHSVVHMFPVGMDRMLHSVFLQGSSSLRDRPCL